MINENLKQKVITALKSDRDLYSSAAKHARKLGISAAQYSRISNGETNRVISDAKWISLARILNVQMNNQNQWKTVKTETYNFIYAQLTACQTRSLSAIFCDRAGIGKTHTALNYVRSHKNAVYIDCSQVKSKQKLIRKIAREFGLDHTGRYADVYEDLVFYIKTIQTPIIILDEAGDLDYPAFLELKAIWNATEYACAWYMMGADGLKEKITRQKNLKKVGYTEIVDRYGNKYNKVTPDGSDALKEFYLNQVALVAKANNSKTTAIQMYAKTNGSLRKVRTEIQKEQLLSA
jgi:transcriptional regulator with XRE-family HTH domain